MSDTNVIQFTKKKKDNFKEDYFIINDVQNVDG